MKNLLCFLFILSICFSCEEKPVEMLDRVVPAGNKTVLIEDFTGIQCVNCPRGARAIENFKTIYGKDRVFSVAVYTEVFDEPFPETKHNLLTAKGQQMQDHLGTLFGKPAAAINRTLNSDSERFYLNPDLWQDPVLDELNRPSELNITMTSSFDPSTRRLEGELAIVPVVDLNVQLNYSIIITEDHIIDPQLDDIGKVLDYEHNHVFRDMLTAPEGDMLGTSFTKGAIVKVPFSYTVPDQTNAGLWIAEHCEILAFVHQSTSASRRVLQTTSAHLTE